MTHKWVGPGNLTRVHGGTFEPGDEIEPTESELKSFGDCLEPTETDETPTPEGGETGSQDDETPLEDKGYQELREMAVEANTNEINGRSSKDEIVDYFSE